MRRSSQGGRLGRSRRLGLEGLEGRTLPAGFIAVGADAGGPAIVRLFADVNNDGKYDTLVSAFQPFGPTFKGGVRVAMGDFDGDGSDELVTATGPGGLPRVIVWRVNGDGTVPYALDNFLAFAPTFHGGLFVAAGDLDGDGKDELAVGSDTGLGRVRVYSDTDSDHMVSDHMTDLFDPFTAAFHGGVRLAFGDTNNNGGEELICATGPGGLPRVTIYTDSDMDRAVSDNPMLETFLAFAPDFHGGVYVAAGPIDINGSAEVITGMGGGADSFPLVKIYSDANKNGHVSDDVLFDFYLAGPITSKTGVRVAAGDTDGSGVYYEVLTANGPGGDSTVTTRKDNGDVGLALSDNAPLDAFQAFPPGFKSGTFLAFGKVKSGYVGSDSPFNIPDLGQAVSTASFGPGAGKIKSLSVHLTINHSYDGDLQVVLTHVDTNKSVTLFSNVGGKDDGFDVTLSDQYGTDIANGYNANGNKITGNYHCEGNANALSAFNGEDASGEWRLTVKDTALTNLGTLEYWLADFTFF